MNEQRKDDGMRFAYSIVVGNTSNLALKRDLPELKSGYQIDIHPFNLVTFFQNQTMSNKREKKVRSSKRSKRVMDFDSLNNLDHLWIELILEANDPRKKFTVRDPQGHLLFYGAERRENFIGRGRGRRFHMTLLNPTTMKEVMNIYRKEVTIWFGCFCHLTCIEQLRITNAPKETQLGTVVQVKKVTPGVVLEVRDARGVTQLRLRGPYTNLTCCGFWDAKFQIFDSNEKVVGYVRQEMSNIFAHNFNLSFPVALDVKIKALLVAVCFMMGFRNNDIREEGYFDAEDAPAVV